MNRTLRKIFIFLSGVFFALYSAYNIMVCFCDRKYLKGYEIIITAAFALAFAMLAAFSFTAGIKLSDITLMIVRRTALIVGLIGIFALKTRMASHMVQVFEPTNISAILYCGAYLMTQAALLLLFFYYSFIVRRLPFFPRASVIIPLIAFALFVFSFIFDAIVFFVFGTVLEASVLRTIVIRPIFYLGFISLCVYFLLPPEIPEK